MNNPPKDRNGWLHKNGLKYQSISRDELDDELREQLQEKKSSTTLFPICGDPISPICQKIMFFCSFFQEVLDSRRTAEMRKAGVVESVDSTEHYKVPFEEVIDLVRQRRVLIRNGLAYVPESDLVSIVSHKVRGFLSKQLSNMARQWPAVRDEEAERLAAFLEALPQQYIGEDYSQPRSGVKVSLDELPLLARRSFPLCMSNMHSKLAETNHLKHDARQQYSLYLKGIGLSFEESMAYWRKEFTKKITGEKFQKDYSYFIRYNYGLEGQRKDWTPYSCMKVIHSPGTNAAAGMHHGCPFRNFDESQLRAQLQQMQVGGSDASYILEKVKGHHYQVACGKYFEAKHKGSTLTETEVGGISHPNQYFEESAKFYAAQVSAPLPNHTLPPLPINFPSPEARWSTHASCAASRDPGSQGLHRSACAIQVHTRTQPCC